MVVKMIIHNRLSFKIVLAILLLNVFCLFTIIVLMWTLKANHVQSGCKTLCSPCSPGVLALAASLCCGCIVKQLSKYLNMQAKQKTDKFLTPDRKTNRSIAFWKGYEHTIYQPWQVNPSSLLEGKRIHQKYDGHSKFQTVRDWTIGHNGYLRNGMEMINGRLFIPECGIYSIYVYILLEETNNQLKLGDMEQKVFRYNILERQETEILSHVRPYTKSRNKMLSMYGNYMSSDVKLKTGDLVYIKVSNMSELRLHDRSYFGTYKI